MSFFFAILTRHLRTTSSVLGCRLGGAPRQQQLDIVHKFHLFNYYFADFSGHFFWTRVYSPLRPPPSLPPLRKFILPKINYSFGGYPPPINPQSIIWPPPLITHRFGFHLRFSPSTWFFGRFNTTFWCLCYFCRKLSPLSFQILILSLSFTVFKSTIIFPFIHDLVLFRCCCLQLFGKVFLAPPGCIILSISPEEKILRHFYYRFSCDWQLVPC